MSEDSDTEMNSTRTSVQLSHWSINMDLRNRCHSTTTCNKNDASGTEKVSNLLFFLGGAEQSRQYWLPL